MKGEEEGPAGLRELDRHWTLRVKEDAEREQGERVEREERKGRKEGGEKKDGKTNAIKIRFSFYFSVYSQFLSWEIPWIQEPGGLQSLGSQRVRHNLVTKQQQQKSTKNLISSKTVF